MTPKIRAAVVTVETLTETVTVSLDGANPVPGILDIYPDPAASAFGLAIQWTITVNGTIGDAFQVPPQHVQMRITYGKGQKAGGGGIIRAGSHQNGTTVIYGEGPLSGCLHERFDDVEFTAPGTGRVRRLRVCQSCDLFVDRTKIPIRLK